MTRNEAREFEDLNPIEGLDEPLVPLNMREVGDEPEEVVVANDAVVEDIAGRITAAEVRVLSSRAGKATEDRERFNYWVCEFYVLKHKEYVIKCLKPIDGSGFIADSIITYGLDSIANCENPAEHIKTWNRKQEINDIINEALSNDK